MATLLLGAAKGLTGLMGMSAMMFGIAVQRMEVQMEEMRFEAVEEAEVAPDAVEIVPVDPGE